MDTVSRVDNPPKDLERLVGQECPICYMDTMYRIMIGRDTWRGKYCLMCDLEFVYPKAVKVIYRKKSSCPSLATQLLNFIIFCALFFGGLWVMVVCGP